MVKSKTSTVAALRAADIPLPTIETVAQLTTLLASSNERLIELQHEATNVTLTEISMRQTEMLKAMNRVADILPWPHLHHANAQRIIEVMRAWFEVVTETQAAMVELMGESFSPRRNNLSPRQAAFPGERRNQSVVIDFPDRRAAA